MSGFRELDEDDRIVLNSWLSRYNIELNHRTRNELRDAFAVAKICKKIHPDLVDLQVYTPRYSMAQMLNNWTIFNERVLKKLDLNLTNSELKELAGGSTDAIESVLYKLMSSEFTLKRGGGKLNLSKKAKKTVKATAKK